MKEESSTEFQEKTKTVIETEKKAEENIPITWIKIFFKTYPRFKNIKLNKPKNKNIPMDKCLIRRRSFRDFIKKPINKEKLSNLLYYSMGIINIKNSKTWNDTRRPYPSAGARYPLEVYLAIFDIRGIEKGIYHYNVKSHSLELMMIGNCRKEMYKIILQPMIKKCNAIIMISSVFSRTETKYGTRAYRYVLLDAGHMSQNICLKAESLNLGCCGIGGFTDDSINKLLDLNPKEEAVIYMLAIGNKPA